MRVVEIIIIFAFQKREKLQEILFKTRKSQVNKVISRTLWLGFFIKTFIMKTCRKINTIYWISHYKENKFCIKMKFITRNCSTFHLDLNKKFISKSDKQELENKLLRGVSLKWLLAFQSKLIKN